MARHRWIKDAVRAPVAMHRMMGVPVDEPFSTNVLRGWDRVSHWVVARGKAFHGHSVVWWKKAGQRARFALNARKSRKRRHRG